jgi:hypothetical protein
LNSGPHTCQSGSLPLEPCPRLSLLYFQIGSPGFFLPKGQHWTAVLLLVPTHSWIKDMPPCPPYLLSGVSLTLFPGWPLTCYPLCLLLSIWDYRREPPYPAKTSTLIKCI